MPEYIAEIKLHFLEIVTTTACDKDVINLPQDKFTWSPLAFWSDKDRCEKCADAIHVEVEPSRA